MNKLDEALDAIWTSGHESRAAVARMQLERLSREDVDRLTAWDYRASFERQSASRLTAVSADGADRSVISYSDSEWVRADDDPPPAIHSLAVLLLVAQFARDHLDSLLLTPPSERSRQISSLSAEWDVDEGRLRRLLGSYDQEVRPAE